MNNHQIVISYKVEDVERPIYKEMLNGSARIVFLNDYEEQERNSLIQQSDILLAWNPPKEFKSIAKVSFNNLKFIQLLSAGYDHLNFEMFPKDCVIASNQGAYAKPMAEHTVAMILALEKLLIINHNKIIGGEFDQRTNTRTLKGKICGIVGFGSIGKATANLLKGFGVKIYGINSTGKTEEKIDFIGTLTDLNYVLKESDILIISIPLNEITRGLIGKKEFDQMKEDSVFINVARGAIVQEEALYEHLKTHPDFMAGIDAWWYEPFNYGEFKVNYPFFELPNILGSPHNSAIIPGALIEGQKRAIENISNYLNGNQIKGIIKR
jgi:phosphoglycerate dehydrogenase-like enzyme